MGGVDVGREGGAGADVGGVDVGRVDVGGVDVDMGWMWAGAGVGGVAVGGEGGAGADVGGAVCTDGRVATSPRKARRHQERDARGRTTAGSRGGACDARRPETRLTPVNAPPQLSPISRFSLSLSLSESFSLTHTLSSLALAFFSLSPLFISPSLLSPSLSLSLSLSLSHTLSLSLPRLYTPTGPLQRGTAVQFTTH